MNRTAISVTSVLTILMLVACVGCIVLAIVFGIPYNNLVSADESVQKAWGDVQSTYQRRADVGEYIVSVVNAQTAQEREIFDTLAEQGAGLAGIPDTAPTSDAEADERLAQYAAYDQALINAVSYVADNPDMVSGQIFQDILVQLEGSENRVAVARRDYNDAVLDYSNATRRFPANILANIFGFDPDAYSYFEADEGAQNAPNLDFDYPGSDN